MIMNSENSTTPSRKRSPNYTPVEINLLVKLCLRFSSTLESKQTDSVIWKKKEETWKIIHTDFNAISGRIPRSVDSLKQKYEGIKKDLKRKIRHNKQVMTGGEPPDYIQLEEYEKPILKIISLQVQGPKGRNDSFADTPETDITGRALQNEHLDEDSDKFQENECGSELFTNDEHDIKFSNDEHDIKFSNDEHDIKFSIDEHDIKFSDDEHDIKFSNDENDISEPSTSSDNPVLYWNSWNPESSRKRKSTTLSTGAKCLKKAEVHERVDQLIYNRQDLVSLQRKLIESEASFKSEEHEEQMKKIQEEVNLLRKMDLRAEIEHQKKMELLELEIMIKRKQLMNDN